MSKNQAIDGLGTHHIAVQTRNWDESMQFYTDVMGMEKVDEFTSDGRRVALLDIGDGSHMELFEPTADTPKPDDEAVNDPITHFALRTTAIHAATERVRAAGMTITIEPTHFAMGAKSVTFAFFNGPSGEVIELLQIDG